MNPQSKGDFFFFFLKCGIMIGSVVAQTVLITSPQVFEGTPKLTGQLDGRGHLVLPSRPATTEFVFLSGFFLRRDKVGEQQLLLVS